MECVVTFLDEFFFVTDEGERAKEAAVSGWWAASSAVGQFNRQREVDWSFSRACNDRLYHLCTTVTPTLSPKVFGLLYPRFYWNWRLWFAFCTFKLKENLVYQLLHVLCIKWPISESLSDIPSAYQPIYFHWQGKSQTNQIVCNAFAPFF